MLFAAVFLAAVLSALASTMALVWRRQDQSPEHFILGLRRIDRGDAHARYIRVEHIGAMRWRIAPAGKRLGQRMVAAADIFDRNRGIESRLADALLERRTDAMIERAARRH